MDKRTALAPAWEKRLHLLVMLTLVVSGFGQMPLFKRYYISDIPGMAWSADFFITHKLHYAAGAIFLFMAARWTVRFFRQWRKTHVLTTLGAVRVGLYAGVALTGLIRTPGNLNGWHWNPTLTMALDLGHLALVMLLGAASALAFMSFGGYLEHRDAVADRKARQAREKTLREKENQVRARGAKPTSGCAPSG